MENTIIDALKKMGIDLSRFSLRNRLAAEFDKMAGEEATGPLSDKADQSTPFFESSLSRVLAGDIGQLQSFYFPADIFGGCCPRVVGEEEEIVWNAAAEAADTERVHLVWQAVGDKIWYLAVRSADMASHTYTWCPFASLLPGQKDAKQIPACYTHYTDEVAMMMTITEDGLQIHRGTTAVLRVKSERTVHELVENGSTVSVTELVPDVIEKLTAVPWYSLSLFEDRARRILAFMSVVVALGLAGVAIFVWLVASMSMISSHGEISVIKERTRDKTSQLLLAIQSLHASKIREQLAQFAELNDNLLALNGYLEVYQIAPNGKVLWYGSVPANVTSNRISELGGQTFDTDQQSVIIGNNKDALRVKKGGR